MSDAKSPPELSMDEILVSIRRILAEDERSTPSLRENVGSAAAPSDDEDVFELTQAIEANGTVRSLVPGARPVAPVNTAGEAAQADVATVNDALTSPAATGSIAASFARLAETPPAPEPAMPIIGGQPLEDVLPEMLRPLLQSWLDAHLPEIVERLVKAEIARITEQSRKG